MLTDLPPDALLARYAIDANGMRLPHYTDRFQLALDSRVALAEWVPTFYTTPLFRSGRFHLSI